MKKAVIIFIAAFVFLNIGYSFAEGERLTQGEFAVSLLKNMKLDDQLPLAPLSEDAVSILEGLGICPLSGWDKNAYLSEDDYTVILAKAVGKEKVVFTKATEVCQKTSEIISNRWHNKYQATGRFERLAQFLSDKNYFPQKPQCPYGLPYKDENNDHQVDAHYHPFAPSAISH